MPRKPPATDRDNPEWTKADFKRAKAPDKALPKRVLAAFKKTRGPQKTPTKIPVSIRLSPEVVAHFKADGPGWQSRIDDTLRKAAGLRR
ncbi:MAG: BrnA antitoxin family protein [Alphaproteobacteria bacterium]